jgi:Flp pilus assembly protein TadD
LGCAHQEGRSEEAVTLIRRSLELEPDRADWHSNLGIVLRDRLELDEAIAACRRAIALDPDHANAHNNLGVLLRAQGRVVEAEAAYRAAIRVSPEHSDAYTNLGILLTGQKRTREAAVCFFKVITFRPKHPEARRLLALAHCALGEVDEAVAIFEEWLKEEPDHPIARHMIAASSGRDVPPRASDAHHRNDLRQLRRQLRCQARQAAYRAPDLVAAMLDRIGGREIGNARRARCGCGTGLWAPSSHRMRAGQGIDLSSECRLGEAGILHDCQTGTHRCASLRDVR